MDEIFLNNILNISRDYIYQYKIKFHVYNVNSKKEPLSVMSRNFDDLKDWIAWKNDKDDLPRKYVIAFVRYYTSSAEQWIFAGTYKVIKKADFSSIKNDVGYDLELLKEHEKFIGKLVVEFKNNTQQLKRNAENIIDNIRVVEILKKKYDGVPFTGYENVSLSFEELEVIIKNNVILWKNRLDNITGIYMLFDLSNGKKYIGSAYGQEGIWQRWSCYIHSTHGGNKELLQLPQNEIKKNFRFSLLEWHKIGTDKDFIITRENYWKEVLMSRKNQYGYNDN